MWKEEYVEAIVVVICGILLVVRLWGTKRRFPPGPFAWPIVGHTHLLGHLPHQRLSQLSKKYGHMIGLRLGGRRAVVVSSPQLAKEVLQTHDKIYANRPPHKFTSNLFYQNDIIFSAYGPLWRKQRKLCMVELFTAKRLQELEYVRQDELSLLLRRILDDSCGGMCDVDIGRCVGTMSSRLVMRLLQSQASAEVAGENLHELISATEQQSTPTLGDLIPWLSWLDFSRMRRMHCLHARIDKVLSTILEERKQSNSHYDDLLQALLAKQADSNTASSDQETLTLHEIKSIMMLVSGYGVSPKAPALPGYAIFESVNV